jgi:hypothetical protein
MFEQQKCEVNLTIKKCIIIKLSNVKAKLFSYTST